MKVPASGPLLGRRCWMDAGFTAEWIRVGKFSSTYCVSV